MGTELFGYKGGGGGREEEDLSDFHGQREIPRKYLFKLERRVSLCEGVYRVTYNGKHEIRRGAP